MRCRSWTTGSSETVETRHARFWGRRSRLSIGARAGLLRFGSRVGAVVYARQVLEIKMRIDLGGGDIGVAEKFLHAPQITTRFKQMGRERMSEQVWMNLHAQALALRPMVDSELDGAHAEPSAGAANEEGMVLDVANGAAFLEPDAERGRRHSADRHDA